jgi:hypothetical protein
MPSLPECRTGDPASGTITLFMLQLRGHNLQTWTLA